MKINGLIFFIVLIILNNSLSAQISEEETRKKNTDPMKTWAMGDTKKIQQHYQNIFSLKTKEKEDEFGTSFNMQKDKILDRLREYLPLQGPVEPESYVIGPGDLIDVSIWGSLPINYAAFVNPEGSLIIPTIGSVDLSNTPLSDAKRIVEQMVKETYSHAEVTTTLLAPRIFSVSVGGVVSNPGNYYASPVQRVDEVIYLANLESNLAISNVSDVQTKKQQLLNRPDVIQYFRNDELKNEDLQMSLRNIEVIRKNGDTLSVDLIKYYATGDLESNPFLSDGDRIIVPNLSLEGNSITISGEVRLEGEYEYSPNDSLSSINSISQGPTKLADLENVNLYRTNLTNGEVQKYIINFNEVISDKNKDVALQPGDRIVFRKKYPFKSLESITIKGEVNLPGLYPILKNSTKLTEIIAEAGGFTNDASLSEAKILRFSKPLDAALTNPDYSRLEEMRLSDLNNRQREYFNYEFAIKRDFVAVDFIELFEKDNSNYDVTLFDGDIVLVPPVQNTVYVYGQILYDGFYNFQPGKDFQFYIDLAGGYSDFADDGLVKVIKVGTKNWVDADETDIQPGDAIWIPRRQDRNDKDFEYYFSWFRDVVGVLAGIATVIIVVQK